MSRCTSGHAFISTPNRALFSFSKEKSFLNSTHVKELFFEEFKDLIRSTFSDFTMYSQIHTPYWHSAYINYLSVSNFCYALRYECFGDSFIGRLFSKIGRFLYVPIFLIKLRNYPDIRKRRFTDFEFVEGFDSRAIWFVAVCKEANDI